MTKPSAVPTEPYWTKWLLRGLKCMFLGGVLYLALVAFTPVTEWQWKSLSAVANQRAVQFKHMEKADAAIILGYTLTREGGIGPVLEERLQQGLRLYIEGKAGKMLVSGGRQNGTIQAEVMAAWLRSQLTTRGYNERQEDVVLEGESFNTWQNAELSLKMARQMRWKKVIIVTNSFHQMRSLLVFEKMELRLREAAVKECMAAASSNKRRQDNNLTKGVPSEETAVRGHKCCMGHEEGVHVAVAEEWQGENVARWMGQLDYVREVGAMMLYMVKGRVDFYSALHVLFLNVVCPYLLAGAVLVGFVLKYKVVTVAS